jgi:hypothetical protein
VAFTLYIFGIAIVLYTRPKIMFNSNGSWKEFGVGRGDDHTVLPFWFFSIFWAFISYGVALVLMSQFATLSMSPPEMNYSQAPPPTQSIQMPTIQQGPPVANHGMMPSMLSVGTPYAHTESVPNAAPTSAPVAQMQTPDFMRPVSSMMGIPNSAPGYYVLQNQGQAGPQYVYYGQTPPPLR